MHLKIASPSEKNYTESSEETHQSPHVVNQAKADDKHVVRHRANHMVKLCGRSREQHIIPSPQVLYCNSCEGLCQGRFEIKPELKI